MRDCAKCVRVCKGVRPVENCGSFFDGSGTPLQCICVSCGRFASCRWCWCAATQPAIPTLQAPPAAWTRPTDSPNLPRTVWKITEEAGFLRPSYADCRVHLYASRYSRSWILTPNGRRSSGFCAWIARNVASEMTHWTAVAYAGRRSTVRNPVSPPSFTLGSD